MFNFTGMNRRRPKRDLSTIEAILQSSLKPVSPRPEFIRNLHKGLMDYTFPQPQAGDADLVKTVLFGMAGLASMVFVISLWVRLIIVVISTLGMLTSSKRTRITN